MRVSRDFSLAISLAFCLVLFLEGCHKQRVAVRPPLGSATPSAASLSSDEKVGFASWYGDPYHGRRTSNGETYNKYSLTAAHRTLAFDSVVKVNNLENGKVTTVRIND